LKSDYRQAQYMLRNSIARIDDPSLPFPTDIPPYAPVVEERRIVTDSIRKVNAEVCSKFGLDPQPENDDYLKFIPKNPGKPKFVGFVNEHTEQYDVHWRFNPYSEMGTKLVTEMYDQGATIVGKYCIKNKEYNFKYYVAQSPYYIIHSDIWYTYTHTDSGYMSAFSLAAKYSFWKFETRKRREQWMPQEYHLVSVSRCLSMPPYDISNPLGRLKTEDDPPDDVGYMGYGSSYVYTMRLRSFIYLGKEIMVQWLRAAKLKVGTKMRLCYVKKNHLYERKHDYIVRSNDEVYIQDQDHSAIGQRVIARDTPENVVFYDYFEANVYSKEGEYIYVFDECIPYHEICVSTIAPVPTAYRNRSGASVLTRGIRLSNWIHLKKRTQNYSMAKRHTIQFAGEECVVNVRIAGLEPCLTGD